MLSWLLDAGTREKFVSRDLRACFLTDCFVLYRLHSVDQAANTLKKDGDVSCPMNHADAPTPTAITARCLTHWPGMLWFNKYCAGKYAKLPGYTTPPAQLVAFFLMAVLGELTSTNDNSGSIVTGDLLTQAIPQLLRGTLRTHSLRGQPAEAGGAEPASGDKTGSSFEEEGEEHEGEEEEEEEEEPAAACSSEEEEDEEEPAAGSSGQQRAAVAAVAAPDPKRRRTVMTESTPSSGLSAAAAKPQSKRVRSN